jgi:hypothetical protein
MKQYKHAAFRDMLHKITTFHYLYNRKYQQYALTCTSFLFYVLAPTCFGSRVPSSGSFLAPPELLEIQIEWVEYHIHTGHVTTHYMIYHQFDLYFK